MWAKVGAFFSLFVGDLYGIKVISTFRRIRATLHQVFLDELYSLIIDSATYENHFSPVSQSCEAGKRAKLTFHQDEQNAALLS